MLVTVSASVLIFNLVVVVVVVVCVVVDGVIFLDFFADFSGSLGELFKLLLRDARAVLVGEATDESTGSSAVIFLLFTGTSLSLEDVFVFFACLSVAATTGVVVSGGVIDVSFKLFLLVTCLAAGFVLGVEFGVVVGIEACDLKGGIRLISELVLK